MSESDFASEIAERQLWLQDMLRVQQQNEAALLGDELGVLSAKGKKSIKVVQRKACPRAVERMREALTAEERMDEIRGRLRRLVKEEAEKERVRAGNLFEKLFGFQPAELSEGALRQNDLGDSGEKASRLASPTGGAQRR